MKITGVRPPAIQARPGRGAPATAGSAATAAAGDTKGFLGLGEADLTPRVRGALQTLLSEIDDLRSEVGQLKVRLAETQGLADRDALTPLLNRRAFMRELTRVRTFAQRYGAPASLVYFDLDGMKAINDQFGHAAGDTVLQTVAERLTTHVRESDIVARIGGDEFAVLLVQADRATAEAKAATLAKAVEGAPLTFDGRAAPLHVSYGVCEITQNGEPESLLAAADAAMYGAKRARRAG